MREFNDKNGNAWPLNLTVGAVMRLRRQDERFDLFDSNHAIEGKPLSSALWDPVLFWELLWNLIEPEAKSRGISAEQFGEAMASDCLITSQLEFFAEWRDFFHGLQRQDHALALEKVLKYRAESLTMVNEALATSSPKVDEIAKKQMATAMNAGLGKLRELLESAQSS